MGPMSATQPQAEFIESLRKQLHLSKPLLDNHCVKAFGCELADLGVREASLLIDEMKGWTETSKGVPPVIQREAGQADLPGFGE
jgi:hypothetical protein